MITKFKMYEENIQQLRYKPGDYVFVDLKKFYIITDEDIDKITIDNEFDDKNAVPVKITDSLDYVSTYPYMAELIDGTELPAISDSDIKRLLTDGEIVMVNLKKETGKYNL